MRVRAFAKINLWLRVLGRRPDGYHELRTIFQSIALHDTLTIDRARTFTLACDDPTCPNDRTNLIWRAAEGVWKAASRTGSLRGVSIHLAKRIPIMSGLGGGSSDAAATIRALGTLWDVAPAQQRLVAARLGADVGYFLEGGTVLGLERGDLLFPLQDYAPAWVTLVVPAFGVSTQQAYAWFDGQRRQRQFGLRRGAGATSSNEITNDLEAAVVRQHPEIATIVTSLRRRGAEHAAMSGSGSAVFGLFATRRAAAAAAAALGRPGQLTLVTRTLNRSSYRRLSSPQRLSLRAERLAGN